MSANKFEILINRLRRTLTMSMFSKSVYLFKRLNEERLEAADALESVKTFAVAVNKLVANNIATWIVDIYRSDLDGETFEPSPSRMEGVFYSENRLDALSEAVEWARFLESPSLPELQAMFDQAAKEPADECVAEGNA